MKPRTIQDRLPNFRLDGRLCLVRCYACNPQHGRENYAPAVAIGQCAWCGWAESFPGETESVQHV